MEIHGVDLHIDGPPHEGDLRVLVDVILAAWPEAVIETDNVKHTPLRDFELPTGTFDGFVYRTREAADAWDEDGWTTRFGNDLIWINMLPDVLCLTLGDESKDFGDRLIDAVLSSTHRTSRS